MTKSNSDILQQLVEKYLEEKTTTILGKIYQQLIPFLSKKARYITTLTGQETDDIMQELYFVLIKRLKSYNLSKGKFLTYLHNTMQGDPTDTLQAMVKKCRGGDGKSRYLSLQSLNKKVYEEGNTELHETIPSDLDLLKELILNTDIKELVKDAPKKFKDTLELLGERKTKIKSTLDKKELRKIYRYLKTRLSR